MMAEAVTVSVLFPFVPFMVRDFHVADTDEKVGYYAGLIASCFFLAQFPGSLIWGMASDRCGCGRFFRAGIQL